MLSDRRQKVLRALIEEYVECALPVGSRTLTEHYDLGVSAATVRNELSALEEGGYISQPHTSSGRIPTDFGYRTFVDSLIESGAVEGVRNANAPDAEEFDALTNKLRQYATELDDLMEQTSAALARLTDCLSIVVAPSANDLEIKQITLVCMDAQHVMLVLVTCDGQVLNRQMEVHEAITPEQVAAIQVFLNEKLAGKTYACLEGGLQQVIVQTYCKTYAEGDIIEQILGEIVACLRTSCHEKGVQHCHRLGLSALMAQPEFSNSSALVPIMQMLEDETVLLQLLDMQSSCAMSGSRTPNAGSKANLDVGFGAEANVSSCSGSNANATGVASVESFAPTVTIGTENSSFGLPGVSVVAGRYGRGDSAGVVAVIGPTRMNYSKVISAVRAATQALRDD